MSEDSEIESIIPRKEKHKKMIEHNLIRRSTPDCFVVPCLERSFGFKTNEFVKNVDKLGLYIEQVEFEGFVRQGTPSLNKPTRSSTTSCTRRPRRKLSPTST